MIRRFVASLVLAAIAGLVIKSLPDIARYLKMREMYMDIVGYVFLGLIAVGVVVGIVLFVTAVPDIARYLRIRRM
jgi:hypothetical protein